PPGPPPGRREALLPVLLDGGEGMGGGCPVAPDAGGVLGPPAATPLLRICEAEVRPHVIRAVREAGNGRADGVVHMPARLERAVERHDARTAPRPGIVAEREP